MEKNELKKMTIATRDEIASRLHDAALKAFVEKIKAAGDEDNGTFEVIISTANQDRQGDSVDQSKWDLTFYKMNPVVLWGHDYYSLPIGICDSVEETDKGTVAKGRFASAAANPFAQQVRALYDAKIVRATSVGYIPAAMRMDGNQEAGNELLEFSFVPVPANPYALSLADFHKFQEKKFDFAEALLKGIRFEVEKKEADKDAKPGDSCQMDDGTLGVYGIGSDGALVCQPKEDKAAADDNEPNSPSAMEALQEALKAEHGRHADEVMKCINEYMKATTPADDETDEQKAARMDIAKKIGATISAKNKSKLQDTADHLTSALATIKELMANGDEDEPDGDEDEDDDPSADEGDDDDANDKGRKPNKGASKEDIELFYATRSLLKGIATSTNEALEAFNKKHHDLKK